MPDPFDLLYEQMYSGSTAVEDVPQPDDPFAQYLAQQGGPKKLVEEVAESRWTDNWIANVIEKGAASTSVGLATRAFGGWDYQPEELGFVGNTAAEVLGFVADPATYLGGGVGAFAVKKLLGKTAFEKLALLAAKKGASGFAGKSILAGSKAGGTLGIVAAARDPFQQYIDTRSFDPLTYAGHVAQSTAVGAALGPGSRFGPLGEVAALSIAQPIVEGRLPTVEDIEGAAGAVFGMKLVGVTSAKVMDLVRNRRERIAAGQKDPTPNKEERTAAGLPVDSTRKQAGEFIAKVEERIAPVKSGDYVPIPGTDKIGMVFRVDPKSSSASIFVDDVPTPFSFDAIEQALTKRKQEIENAAQEAQGQVIETQKGQGQKAVEAQGAAVLEEIQDAVETRKIEQGRVPERPGISEVRPTAEAGRGDRAEEGGQVEKAPQGVAISASKAAVTGHPNITPNTSADHVYRNLIEAVGKPAADELVDDAFATYKNISAGKAKFATGDVGVSKSRLVDAIERRYGKLVGKERTELMKEGLWKIPDRIRTQEAPQVVVSPASPAAEVSETSRLSVANERVKAADNAIRARERELGLHLKGKNKQTVATIRRTDVKLQGLFDEKGAAERSRSAIEGGITRAKRAAIPEASESQLAAVPIDELPGPVAQRIQAEAQMQLDARAIKGGKRISSPKSREALLKIIRDKGEDVGSEVQRQKKRLIEYLMAEKDFRTIFEKDLGVPRRENPDAVIEAYLAGATDADIMRIATGMDAPSSTEITKARRIIADEMSFGPELEEAQALIARAELAQEAPPAAARPGLFGQETFDSVTGRQQDLLLGEFTETAPQQDVPGQQVIPGVRPETVAARAETAKRRAELEQAAKKSVTLGFGPVMDPEVLKAVARWAASAIKSETMTFRDYVAELIRRFGKAVVRSLADPIRQTWIAARETKPKLEEPGDVAKLIEELPGEEFPKTMRPDLAIPGITPEQRGMMRAVDNMRTAAGEPGVVTRERAGAEADQRVAADYEGEKARLLSGDWVPAADGADTYAAASVLRYLQTKAATSGTLADNFEAAKAGHLYREGRGTTARELGAGVDPQLSPEQRQAQEAGQAFFRAPEKIEKAVRKARAYEKRQKAKEEVKVAVGQPATTPSEPAPEAKPKKPRKSSEDWFDDWTKMIPEHRAKLEALGHNVDAVLRGQADALATAAMIRDAGALKAPFGDKMYEWWSNSILSGPATQTTNALGNVVHAGWYFTAERITETIVDSIVRSTGLRSGGARWGELRQIVHAMIDGHAQAAKNFWLTWRTEQPSFYETRGLEIVTAYGHRPPSIAGKWGKRIRTPWRTLAAVDDYVKTQVAHAETTALAYRDAINAGVSKGKVLDYMQRLMEDPSSEASLRGTDAAIRLAFQESSKVEKQARNVIHAIPGGRYVLPFIVTPFNILKSGVRKSPFGSLKLAKSVLEASRTGDWSGVSQRTAEQVLAWGAVLAIGYMNDPKDPFITGVGGTRPYSVKIGNEWYYYGRIEPFATTLGLMVDAINKVHQGADLSEALQAPFDALLDRVDNQTFFTGLGDFMKAARYGDSKYVAEWAAKFPASWIPNVVRAPLRAEVETQPQRRVWGKGNERYVRMVRRGVEATEMVPSFPRYDLWGRPVPKDGAPIPGTDWLFRTLSPVAQRRYIETLGDRLLLRWNASHPNEPEEFRNPNQWFTVKGETFYMTDEEYDFYVRESGKLTFDRVARSHERKAFNLDDPTERDMKRLRKIIQESRGRIRDRIKKNRAMKKAG